MRSYRCKLLEIRQTSEGAKALIIRLEDHAVLGAPYEGRTVTSAIEMIDFRRRLMITQNSIYTWGEP